MVLLLKLTAIILYPLGLGISTIIVGLILLHRKVSVAGRVITAGVTFLYLISTPIVSRLLIRPLEAPYEGVINFPADCSAIVVLGGSGKPMSIYDHYAEINEAGDRLLHTARLFREGWAPRIVTSGGFSVGGLHQMLTEGRQNALVLRDMGIDSSAIVIEPKSRTTADHGPYIAALFDSLGLQKKIVLVTSAAHMYRSLRVFRKWGFTAFPAATDFQSNRFIINGVKDLFPGSGALNDVTAAIHEYYGIVGYKFFGKM